MNDLKNRSVVINARDICFTWLWVTRGCPPVYARVFESVGSNKSWNFGCHGLRNSFYNSFLSLKLALRVMSNDTNNVFSKGWYIEQSTPKLCKNLQNCCLRTPFCNTFCLKLALRVISQNTNNVYSKGYLVYWTKCPKFVLKASHLWMVHRRQDTK